MQSTSSLNQQISKIIFILIMFFSISVFYPKVVLGQSLREKAEAYQKEQESNEKAYKKRQRESENKTKLILKNGLAIECNGYLSRPIVFYDGFYYVIQSENKLSERLGEPAWVGEYTMNNNIISFAWDWDAVELHLENMTLYVQETRTIVTTRKCKRLLMK